MEISFINHIKRIYQTIALLTKSDVGIPPKSKKSINFTLLHDKTHTVGS